MFACYFSNAQIYSTYISGTGTPGSPYKLDVDNDGVKDFWLSIVDQGSTTASGVYVITGKNGNKLEAETGVEANRLEYGNAVGNNIWADSIVLVRRPSSGAASGNFAGTNSNGYIGFQLKKGVNIYYGWMNVSTGFYLSISAYGYNTLNGGVIKAGQEEEISAINETKPLLSNAIWSRNSINVSFAQPSEIKHIAVYDLTGKVIYKQTEINQDISINTSDISSGILIVETADVNGRFESIKLHR